MFLVLLLSLLCVSIQGFGNTVTSSRNMVRFGTSYGIKTHSSGQLQQKSNKRDLSMNFFDDLQKQNSNFHWKNCLSNLHLLRVKWTICDTII